MTPSPHIKCNMFFRNLFIILLFPIVFLFQNCSQVKFLSLNASEKASDQNGGGYGGKPTGQFYRFTPDFTCENKVSYVMNLNLTDTTATLTENKKLLCGAVKSALDINLIDTSIYQNEIIGFQDGIFESLKSEPSNIPANLVEVWCRDTKDQTGIETITHFDRTTNSAVNRIYYASASGKIFKNKIILDFPVARSASSSTVHIRDENGFDLVVHRDQPAPDLGLFVGELNAMIEGKPVSRQTYCRFGGGLDSTVWPVKQIVDFNIATFKLSYDKNNFSYTTGEGGADANSARISISNLDGTKQKTLSTNYVITNWSFKFSPDSKKLLYLSDDVHSTAATLYLANVDGSSNTAISKDIVNSTQYDFTGDNQFVVFNSGIFWDPWLRSVPVAGGITKSLNPILTPAEYGMGIDVPSHTQVQYSDTFQVSASSQKVAFIYGHWPINIYASNANGTELVKLTPNLPSNYVVWYGGFPSLTSDKIVEVYASTHDQQSAIVNKQYAVSSNGSTTVEIPTGWQWVSTSPTAEYGIMYAGDQAKIINLSNGQTFNLPPKMYNSTLSFWTKADTSSFFSPDSNSYTGLVPDSVTGRNKIESVSTKDGSIKEVCPQISASNIQKLGLNQLVIIENDSKSALMKVYIHGAGLDCKLVNAFPVQGVMTGITSIVSADLQKLLINRVTDGKSETLLFYVPLNGRPAYVINKPVFNLAIINSYDFSSDFTAVIYTGDQIRPGVINAYHWPLPK